MEQVAFESLKLWLLWSGFGLSFVFGVIAQSTHFCTMGAITDVFNTGDWSRARQWLLAMAVAMTGFSLLSLTGQIRPDDSPLPDPALELVVYQFWGADVWFWHGAGLGLRQ